jgi:hypothetical protein
MWVFDGEKWTEEGAAASVAAERGLFVPSSGDFRPQPQLQEHVSTPQTCPAVSSIRRGALLQVKVMSPMAKAPIAIN